MNRFDNRIALSFCPCWWRGVHTVFLLHFGHLQCPDSGCPKILHAHGLCRMAIQAVFRSVILARLLYASPAWWGFAAAQYRQKVYSFLRRSARVGFYSSDLAIFDDLCIQADENLFNKVLHNPDHVLHRLLPPVAHTSHNYNLRPRAHDRSLPERLTHLTDCNFIIRTLFYHVYWL